MYSRMFKTNMGLVNTLKKLLREEGWAFGVRYIATLYLPKYLSYILHTYLTYKHSFIHIYINT